MALTSAASRDGGEQDVSSWTCQHASLSAAALATLAAEVSTGNVRNGGRRLLVGKVPNTGTNFHVGCGCCGGARSALCCLTHKGSVLSGINMPVRA